MSQSESRSEIVAGLADQFLARYRRGERPSLKEYIERHPELAEEIREVFPALAMMENIALADESLAASQDTGETGVTAGIRAPLEQLGDYRIIREVGHGGMGIVYEAEQVSLGRHVALKLVPQKLLLGAKQKQRFEREAKAAAKLHHTNIVPVFGVGEQDGMPYYVMQFIQGLGLDEVLSELKRMRVPGAPTPSMPAEGELRISRHEVSAAQMARSLMIGDFTGSQSGLEGKGAPTVADQLSKAERLDPTTTQISDSPDSPVHETATGRFSDTSSLSASSVILPGQSVSTRRTGKKQNYWQSVASIGVQVADALDYAHKQGVLHRDIKPSNLLLDTRGTVWVTDFGLAKTTDDQQNLTHTGDILGTLRYMAPEAFEGRSSPRSDVYSLGLTIYELLALKPAFPERDRHQLIKKVTTEDPARLNRLNAAIPRDLVTIVHKAIDKDPGQRYLSAEELEADLQRFIEDEPIKARRLTQWERSWRWCRHNPLVAGLAAALLLLLLSSTIGSLMAAGYYDRLAKKEAQTAQDERDARQEAQANLEEVERQKQRAQGNFARARAAVDDYLTKVSESQLIKVPGLQPLRRELLESALIFYQQFLKEQGDDPAIQTELAAAYLRIARIQSELGNRDESRKSFDLAIAGYEAALRSNPQSEELKYALATAFQNLGMMYFYSDHKESLRAFAKAVDLQVELLKTDPSSEEYKRELAKSYNGLAVMQNGAGDVSGAFGSGQRCLELRQELVLSHPDSPVLHHAMGESLVNLGFMLNNRGHLSEALAMYERALDYLRAAHESMPQVIEFGLDLHYVYRNLANAHNSLMRPDKVLAIAQQDVDHLARFAEANPAVPEAQSNFLDSLLYLCSKQAFTQNATGAAQTSRRVASAINALPSETADSLEDRANLRMKSNLFMRPCLTKLSENDRKDFQHQAEVAFDEFRKAVSLGYKNVDRLKKPYINSLADLTLSSPEISKQYKQILTNLETNASSKNPGDDGDPTHQAEPTAKNAFVPPRSQIQADLALAHYAIALSQIEQEQLVLAERSLKQAQRVYEELDKQADKKPTTQSYSGMIEVGGSMIDWRAGRFGEGKKKLDHGLQLLEAAHAQEPQNALILSQLVDALWKVGGMWTAVGCWEEAAQVRQRAVDLAPKDHWKHFEQAALLAVLGDKDRYARHCDKMLGYAKNTHESHVAEQTAKATLLLPTEPSQRTASVVLADRGLELGRGITWEPYDHLAKALADYRMEDYQAAITTLEGLPSKFPNYRDNAWTLHLPRKAVLAMALWRVGRKDEAQQMLQNATTQQARLRTAFCVVPREGWKFVDGLLSRALIKEASMLIQGVPLSEALTSYLRAHVYQSLGETDKAAKELAKESDTVDRNADLLVARATGLKDIGLIDAALKDLDKALQSQPNLAKARLERAQLYACRRDWSSAVSDLKVYLEKVNDELWGFALASFLAKAGDLDAHHRHCQELVQRAGKTTDPFLAERTAKACLFLPPEPSYRDGALHLADLALTLKHPAGLAPFLHFVKGLAEYRRGNYREAASHCRQSLDYRDPILWFVRVQDHFVLSMALAQAGDIKEAKSVLERGETLLNLQSYDAEHPSHDWLICQFLLEEAKGVLVSKAKDSH